MENKKIQEVFWQESPARCKMTQYICRYQSPLGPVTISGSESALTGLWFDGQKYFGSTLSGQTEERPLPVFDQAKEWLDLYFAGKIPQFTPPLAFHATPFRTAVWKILLEIPYGSTMTYGEIAGMIAKQTGRETMSAQAVGGAVGHNPVSIIVPCHRVVGADKSLTGYAGGIDKKMKLLALESQTKSRILAN